MRLKAKSGPKRPLQPNRAVRRQELHRRIFQEVAQEHPEWPLAERAAETARRVNQASIAEKL